MKEDLLVILGSSIDEFYEAEQYPTLGHYVENVKDMGMAAGGPMFNVGCVCASKGGKVKALDYLSNTQNTSKFLVSVLNQYGVNTDYIQYGECVNAKVVIIKTDKERTMFVVPAVRPYYVVDEKLQEKLNNSKYIYSMMHVLNRSFDGIDCLLEARKQGTKIFLDGCSEYTKEFELKMVYSLCDGLFINSSDYENLKSKSDKDPKELLFSNGCEFICITDGEKGATCITKDKVYKTESINTKVIDSTGAGDSFAGTFIYGLQKGYSYNKCLRFGSVAGSYACTKVGGQAACVSEEELYKYAKTKNYDIDLEDE